MSNVENSNQPSSSLSKSTMHNASLVDLSEDEQLQRAIKMSEKEEMFRVEIYSCKKLNTFQSNISLYYYHCSSNYYFCFDYRGTC